MIAPWASDPYLVVPYQPFVGASNKNDIILTKALEHPERFLVSRFGDAHILVARLLTSPESMVWEVWHQGQLCGILILDRIVPAIDARMHLVFFDDELASKVALLREFTRRCFADFGLARLSFEAPEHNTTLLGFVRRKLGFRYEGESAGPGARRSSRRERAYWDGARWQDVVVLRKLAEGAT